MPVASAPTKPQKSGLKSFGKFVLWCVAICVVLEIVLRFFGFGSYVVYKPDERMLWLPQPGTHRVTEMNHEAETINSQNFRYREVLSLDHPSFIAKSSNPATRNTYRLR